MNLFKKIFIVAVVTIAGLSSYAQGPYHEDVGNGKWVIIERIRSIKAMKFADGTTQNTAFTAGAMVNTITLTGTTDTVEFPELPKIYQFDVIYQVTFDTLDSDDVSIILEEKQYIDSTYTNKHTSIFPYTLESSREGVDYGYYFLVNQALQHQRFIVDWGTSTVGTLVINRKY